MKKKVLLPIGIVLSVLLLLGGGLGIYFGSYYRAKLPAEALQSTECVQVMEEDDYIVFRPLNGYDDALIFYQGAKVAEEAYAPMLKEIAEGGVLCFLVKMPLNFALLNIDAAEGIMDEHAGENVEWYLAGHSLGGSMAAMYAGENPTRFKGVILYASYSTKPLHDLEVLSVFGENDEVLNFGKYQENKANLPKGFGEVVIEGGNHANFGHYGEQRGDGKATLSREEQITIAAQSTLAFILE